MFLVSNGAKLSRVEDHANAVSVWAKLRPITRKVILSWLLPLPGLLRMPRPLDVSGVGGDGFWTQRTGLASPGRQVSLKWESSSSLVFSPSWLNEKHVSPSSTSSRLWHHSTKKYVKSHFVIFFPKCLKIAALSYLPSCLSPSQEPKMKGLARHLDCKTWDFFCEQPPKS